MEFLKVEDVDNSIERNLKLAIVQAGYWIDEVPYIQENNEDGWHTALGMLPAKIEVFGTGAPRDRKTVKDPRIVITRSGFSKGSVGYMKKFYFEEVTNEAGELLHYRKYMVSEGLFNVGYEVRYVCNSIEIDRVITGALVEAFSFRRYLYGISSDLVVRAVGFYLVLTGTPVNLSGSDYIEQLYRYTAQDIPLEVFKLIGTVPTIDEITFDIGSTAGETIAEASEIMEE